MRLLFMLSLLGASASCFASYELALIVDDNPAGARVERFDPQTGAYFGSFGLGGVANGAAIAADVNSGTALVQGSGTGMRLYDYSTGNVIASFSSNLNRTLAFANGYYWGTYNFAATGSLYRYSTSGASLGTALPLSTVWSFVTAGVDGSLLAADFTNGDLWRTTSTNPNAGSWTKIYDGAPASVFNSSKPAATSYLFGSAQAWELLCFEPSGMTRYLDFSANYASLLSTGTYGNGIFTDIGGFSRAHIGIFQTGMQGATPIVVGYDSSHGTYTSFGSSILKDPQNMAIVLAPEPSSLVSSLLGLGALSWFVRKRK